MASFSENTALVAYILKKE